MSKNYSKNKVPFKAYEGNDPYIFISYKHADSDIVFPVIKQFNDAGFNIWYDDGLQYGEDYDDLIDLKIDESSLFVICITERVIEGAYDSEEYMKKELDVAIDTGTNIFPIFLEDVGLKGKYRMQLQGKHSIFRQEYDEKGFIDECINAFKDDFGIESNSAESDEEDIFEYDFEFYESARSDFNFRYLDDLINGDVKKDLIVLNQDITLDVDETNSYNDGISIKKDNLTIDGNGHSIDARYNARIFNISGENIILKNIKFKNAHFKENGGALFIDKNATLEIDECHFENNFSNSDGGAILNFGCVKISNSIFTRNKSNNGGGAIKNETGGSLMISNSQFNYNGGVYGGSIVNLHEILIIGSDFNENKAKEDAGALVNNKRCRIEDSTFSNNSCSCSNEYYLYGGGAVFNHEGFLEINRTVFKSNLSKHHAGAIYDYHGKTVIHNSEFNKNQSQKDGNSLYSEGDSSIKIYNSKFDKFEDEEIFSDKENSIACENSKFRQNFNFRYLDEMIHSGDNEIVLQSNITLDDEEESKYESGIDLDIDGLIIDGNGYEIDACGKTRIFNVAGEVTIKNIVLRNGFAKDGGAIFNSNGALTLSHSKILYSKAENNGGAIWNGGFLTIKDTYLRQNTAQKYGGSVFNDSKSDIKIVKSNIFENYAFEGGAIFNFSGKIMLGGSEFKKNVAKDNGGAIFNHRCRDNCPKLTIVKCHFENNKAKEGGGVWTYNEKGNIQFSCRDSQFHNNEGGNFYIMYNDEFK